MPVEKGRQFKPGRTVLTGRGSEFGCAAGKCPPDDNTELSVAASTRTLLIYEAGWLAGLGMLADCVGIQHEPGDPGGKGKGVGPPILCSGSARCLALE